MNETKQFFSLIKLAKFINVPFYKIRYAINTGRISQPKSTLDGKPIWSIEEAHEIGELFKNKNLT